MMQDTTAQALVQARLADLRDQAQRDALARSAHRVRRQHFTHRAAVFLAALTRRARHPGPAPGACSSPARSEAVTSEEAFFGGCDACPAEDPAAVTWARASTRPRGEHRGQRGPGWRAMTASRALPSDGSAVTAAVGWFSRDRQSARAGAWQCHGGLVLGALTAGAESDWAA